MSVKPADIAAQAIKHLGEASPDNSCVSNGMNRWPVELGLPGIDTASVSEARKLARAGHHGWKYHEGTAGVFVGAFVDWDPDVLGDAADAHVSCVTEVTRAGIKSVGSGGPTGKVAYQPKSGGFNPADYFIGYFEAPTAVPAAAPAAPKPAASSSSAKTYTVKAGDTLTKIAAAHHTTVPAIVKANPAAADRKTRDFHITHAGFILAGQRINLP